LDAAGSRSKSRQWRLRQMINNFHIYWFAPISSDMAGARTFGSDDIRCLFADNAQINLKSIWRVGSFAFIYIDMMKRNDQFFLTCPSVRVQSLFNNSPVFKLCERGPTHSRLTVLFPNCLLNSDWCLDGRRSLFNGWSLVNPFALFGTLVLIPQSGGLLDWV
jgi:hypothetical protein